MRRPLAPRQPAGGTWQRLRLRGGRRRRAALWPRPLALIFRRSHACPVATSVTFTGADGAKTTIAPRLQITLHFWTSLRAELRHLAAAPVAATTSAAAVAISERAQRGRLGRLEVAWRHHAAHVADRARALDQPQRAHAHEQSDRRLVQAPSRNGRWEGAWGAPRQQAGDPVSAPSRRGALPSRGFAGRGACTIARSGIVHRATDTVLPGWPAASLWGLPVRPSPSTSPGIAVRLAAHGLGSRRAASRSEADPGTSHRAEPAAATAGIFAPTGRAAGTPPRPSLEMPQRIVRWHAEPWTGGPLMESRASAAPVGAPPPRSHARGGEAKPSTYLAVAMAGNSGGPGRGVEAPLPPRAAIPQPGRGSVRRRTGPVWTPRVAVPGRIFARLASAAGESARVLGRAAESSTIAGVPNPLHSPSAPSGWQARRPLPNGEVSPSRARGDGGDTGVRTRAASLHCARPHALLDFRRPAVPPAVADAPAQRATAPSPAVPELDLDAISREVMRRIETRLRIERERHGRL